MGDQLYNRECVNNYINQIANMKNNKQITNENDRTQFIIEQMKMINQNCTVNAGGSVGNNVGNNVGNEYFTNTGVVASTGNTVNSTVMIIASIFSICISIYCVYLSWSCNTKLEINTGLKIIYAFFAAIFNVFYLIYYFVFRLGTCRK